MFDCPPVVGGAGSPGGVSPDGSCSGLLIFAQSHIYYSKYRAVVTFYNPYAGFSLVQNQISDNVNVAVSQGFVKEAYTNFEVGECMPRPRGLL